MTHWGPSILVRQSLRIIDHFSLSFQVTLQRQCKLGPIIVQAMADTDHHLSLFGVTSFQTITYFNRYPKDKNVTKVLVRDLSIGDVDVR